ncbi:hydantoinase/oxoprolinase family protein [Peribacillus cavernae]|uniref:Hydantoinase/oxoprolinase family protein n=1 Tax=Peribacillus cavernae TaxID=1674310 RepID=A0A3S0U4P3_9BACI|nr:hydantoinase/oxoprolinase family protein [Peribacillus cavernae]MDQ0218794.1 N-methylhydantoinase A [Peribacillus cavernae]RUQ31003.1 hydantoinase/oxoprolinase family protein [Peribacillus cavernae]
MKLFGVDVGGTFTDVIFSDTDNRLTAIHKVPTTLDDPSTGVIQGILELCEGKNIDKAQIDHVFHGTTIATNAILEYDGAKTGMLTTKGYRDIIHIGRHQRPQNHSIMQDIPWQDRPLVQRRHRLSVTERMGPLKDQVIMPLEESEVRGAVATLKKQGVESIIVNFLFSYINPAHEQRVKEIIEEEYPEAFITISSDVSPQFREFERFTTASINGFVGPKVKNYIQNLEQRLKDSGIAAELHIMSSNGGVATPKTVSEKPVNTLLSGPAAGILGGAWAGELTNREKLITFDIGGTSADIGIITGSGYSESSARDTWIAGYPVMVPMIDIHTIGAGGGSIAHIDEGGAFKVGPKSAGSRPGPACYGHGGSKPTVSDANVVLGRIDEYNFLGGEMQIYSNAAYKVIDELAGELDLSRERTAEGILQIMNNNMANAIRERTVQKGEDPREFSLVAFGGAGPLHAVEVAKILNIPEIIIPLYPGINSATGLLTTDLKYDVIKTEFMLSTNMDFSGLNADFKGLESQLVNQLKEDGITENDIQVARSADCRYAGQGYELRIDLSGDVLDEVTIIEAFTNFHESHKAEYGHHFMESAIEIVNIRVTGMGVMPKIEKQKIHHDHQLEDALLKTGETTFNINGNLEKVETKFYQREKIPAGAEFQGPCIVLQKDTTTVIPPDCTASIEEYGNMIIKVGV